MSPPVSVSHDDLHAFADGELSPQAADAFREHLAGCEACGRELLDILALEALGDGLAEEAGDNVVPLRAPAARGERGERAPLDSARGERAPLDSARGERGSPRWSRRAAYSGAGLALAAAALFVILTRSSHGPTESPAFFAQADTRVLEARLTSTGLNAYRPYEVVRAGNAPNVEQVPLQTLAKLESAGEFRTLAEVSLLRGELDPAAAYLSRAKPSPDVDSDRAVLALQRRQLEEALRLLDGVLEVAPKHAAARWNRGLVLRELGLPLSAAADFRAVAQSGEKGWTTEAEDRARALEAGPTAQGKSWYALWEAGSTWASQGQKPNLEAALAHPGLARLLFYDALRSADTRARAEQLLPLAQALDAQVKAAGAGEHGLDQLLQGEVQKVMKKDFARRGPLAAQYRDLLAGKLDAKAGAAYLAKLEKANEPDLLMGALCQLYQIGSHLDLYRRAARAWGDPWFDTFAAQEEAKAQVASADLEHAERTLLAAIPRCDVRSISMRCVELYGVYAELLLQQQRLDEARSFAQKARALAQARSEFGQVSHALGLLADEARLRNAFAASGAYLLEMERREPARCSVKRYTHEQLAVMDVLEQRFDKARANLAEARSCGEPLSLWALATQADVYRVLGRAEDADAVLSALDALEKTGSLSRTDTVVATYARGRVVGVKDPRAGDELLARAISLADALPHDETAQKARSYAYAYRALAAGDARNFDHALDLMGDAARVPAPKSCTLGVEICDERRVLVARGADGKSVGESVGKVGEARPKVTELVPAALVNALRGCPRVEVLAQYPIYGRAGLLPADMAFSYRVTAEPRVAPTGAPHRLVVTDAEPPASLRLARLSSVPTSADEPANTVRLAGPEATPSRVLAALEDATEVELNAHGLSSPEVSDASFVALSPDADGRYALTVRELRSQKLKGAPVVVLGTCHGAEAAPYFHVPWSLPAAFLSAGARAVIASDADLPDAAAARFFAAVEQRIRNGSNAAEALRDERVQWQKQGSLWVQDVVVFD